MIFVTLSWQANAATPTQRTVSAPTWKHFFCRPPDNHDRASNYCRRRPRRHHLRADHKITPIAYVLLAAAVYLGCWRCSETESKRHVRESKNVLGKDLEVCGTDPVTGYFCDGCCDTAAGDMGSHTVCAIVDDRYLAFSQDQGNDLITPRPEYRFQGLKDVDRWCLSAMRWEQARQAGCAPRVRRRATNIKALTHVSLEHLKAHHIDLN
jgi:uncharacterized protein (DUF2237 family)